MRKRLIAPFIAAMTFVLAQESEPKPYEPPPLSPAAPDAPWLTGSLISNNGYIVPYGNVTLQTYLYGNVLTGIYDSNWDQISTPNFYQGALQIYAYLGLTPIMDVMIVPQAVCNRSQGQTAAAFSDLPIAFDFTVLDYNANTSFPGIKLSFKETFPTGIYNELNPYKNGTQVSGSGTFASSGLIYFYKVYNTNGSHFLSLNLNFGYTVNTPVNVQGFNAYGGGNGCKGKVLPGSQLQGILSFEYTLTQNWVLAIDNVYTHTFKTYFYGDPGTLLDGSQASVGSNSSDWIAFAPSIEYNFSSSLAINIGAYVTAFGRNAPIFRNGIFEFVYNY